MNAYLFSGLVSQYQSGHFMDACTNIILYGGEEDAAWKRFEEILLSRNSGENPTPTTIEKMVGAPVLDQLFTETGNSPINWVGLSEEVLASLESIPLEDQEQGYWVDCDQCVRPENLPAELEWLRRELPEDIRSGLNWAPEKTYFFLVSVLSPPAAPADPVEEMASEESLPDTGEADTSGAWEMEQRLAAFPQLAEKDLAVIVRARNSVVAAWLWRRYAVSTPLAGNSLRVDALCDIVPVNRSKE